MYVLVLRVSISFLYQYDTWCKHVWVWPGAENILDDEWVVVDALPFNSKNMTNTTICGAGTIGSNRQSIISTRQYIILHMQNHMLSHWKGDWTSWHNYVYELGCATQIYMIVHGSELKLAIVGITTYVRSLCLMFSRKKVVRYFW